MENTGWLWLDRQHRLIRWNGTDVMLRPHRWNSVVILLAEQHPEPVLAEQIAALPGFRGEVDPRNVGKITARYVHDSLNRKFGCDLVLPQVGKSEVVFALNTRVLERIEWAEADRPSPDLSGRPAREPLATLAELGVLARGAALQEAGRGAEVRAELEALVREGSGAAATRALLLLAEQELNVGNASAVAELLSGLQDSPDLEAEAALPVWFQLASARLEFLADHLGEARRIVQQLFRSVPEDHALMRARLELFSGVLTIWDGAEPKLAEPFFHRALEACLRSHWWWGVQACFANLGLMCAVQAEHITVSANADFQQGWLKRARDWFQAASAFCQKTGFQHTTAELLVWHARVRRQLNELDQVGPLLDQALLLAQGTGSLRAQAEVHLELGEVAWRLERPAEARRHWTQALGAALGPAERAQLKSRLEGRFEGV